MEIFKKIEEIKNKIASLDEEANTIQPPVRLVTEKPVFSSADRYAARAMQRNSQKGKINMEQDLRYLRLISEKNSEIQKIKKIIFSICKQFLNGNAHLASRKGVSPAGC